MGRFLTRDTYTGEEDEPLSLHLYTYCENDTVNAWDPSGSIPVPQQTPKPRTAKKTKKFSSPKPSAIKHWPNGKKILNVKLFKQKEDLWCGPACLQMVCNYVTRKKISQKKLHKACTGNSRNTTVTVSQMKKAARKQGMSVHAYHRPLSEAEVATQIVGNKPIIARIGWKNGGGHVVVIKGYECINIEEMYIYINDPWPDTGEQKIKYTDFKDHAYEANGGGEGEWTHSLAKFKKK